MSRSIAREIHGLAGGAEPLVVPTEAPVAQQPGEGALDHPAAREHLESWCSADTATSRSGPWGGRWAPKALEALRRPQHLHGPANGRLDPVAALAAPVVARIQPPMPHAGQPSAHRSSSTRWIPSRSITLAGWTATARRRPSVSTRLCRLRPTSCLAPSYAAGPAHAGRLHRLTVDAAGARLRIPAQRAADRFAQGRAGSAPACRPAAISAGTRRPCARAASRAAASARRCRCAARRATRSRWCVDGGVVGAQSGRLATRLQPGPFGVGRLVR